MMNELAARAVPKSADSLIIDCVKCKQRFSKKLPTFDAVNKPKFSSVTATHEKMVICPKCGQAYCFAIRAVLTDWMLQEISDEDRRRIEGSEILSLV